MSRRTPFRYVRRGWLALAALALAECGFGGAPPAGTGKSEGQPPLVFGSQGDIHVLSIDGKTRRQLTKVGNGALARDPAWSPDGSRIAYAYTPPLPAVRGPGGLLPLPVTDLYVMNASGGDQKALVAHQAPGEGMESPVWLPDGKALLVSYTALIMESNIVKDQIVEIARMRLDGGTRETLVPDGVFPALSPDGKRLAYVLSARSGDQSLMIAGADGKSARPLLSPERINTLGLSALSAPRFSPDGKQLVFSAAAPMSSAAPLGGPPPVPTTPPRSQSIGRALAHGLPMDLFAVGADGSGFRRITQLGEDSPAGVWSPDGQRIAMVAGGGIYLTKPDGASLSDAISAQGGHGLIDWRRG